MSEDASEQTSLDEIVDEHSGDDTIDEHTEDDEDSTLETDRIETSIGIMPTKWGVERLSEICRINPDGFSEDDWEGEAFEYISLSEVSEGEILRSETIPLDEAPSRAQREIKAGDVLVGTVRPKQVSHGFVTEEHDGKICSSGFGVLRTGENLNGIYLLQEVLSHRFFRQMEAYVAGSGYPAVKIGDLKKHRIGIPSLPEQRRIASVLYNIDEAIRKTEEIIVQAERVKKGLMQDLLNDGIGNGKKTETGTRYGELPDSWKLRKLNQVGEVAGRTAPEKDQTECWGGDIPWATPSEITSLEGPTIEDTEEHLTEIALEKVSSNLLPPESILLTTRATIGECAINTVEMTTNQGFKSLIPGDDLDTWYVYYRLEYEGDYLASLSKGSTFPEVGKDTVENFTIPVPPLEEQKEIGEQLKNMDEMILSYKSNRDQLQSIKRGLMQDLLSGEVRTADREISVHPEVEKHG